MQRYCFTDSKCFLKGAEHDGAAFAVWKGAAQLFFAIA
jgi:hypothetical protein